MKYPVRVNRVVQMGTMPPIHDRQYPAHLTNADETLRSTVAGTLREIHQRFSPRNRAAYDATPKQ